MQQMDIAMILISTLELLKVAQSKEAFVKVSGNKAKLIIQFVTHWERKYTGNDSLAKPCGS